MFTVEHGVVVLSVSHVSCVVVFGDDDDDNDNGDDAAVAVAANDDDSPWRRVAEYSVTSQWLHVAMKTHIYR